MRRYPSAFYGMVLTAVVAAAALAVAAQEETPPRLEVSASIAGTWNGTYRSTVVPPTGVTLVFQQLGSTVTGSYLSANGAQGVMWGTLQVNGAGDLQAVQTTPTCRGEFKMPVQVAGDRLTWKFIGHDCLGVEDGSGDASRVGDTAQGGSGQ